MPLISDEVLKSKLEHPSNIAQSSSINPSSAPEITGKIVPLYRGGRRNGDTNIGPLSRVLIGATAQLEGQKSAAETFGVTQMTASNLENGKINGKHKDLEHAAKVEEMVGAVQNKALDILQHSLGLIQDDSAAVADLPIRGKAGFAKDIASIVGSLKQKDQAILNAGQIIMMAPPMDKMEDLLPHATIVVK